MQGMQSGLHFFKQFKITINHKSGASNKLVDALIIKLTLFDYYVHKRPWVQHFKDLY